MKNKKGFTLLEVLAVLVVLAVIALITIPIVTGVMKDAKRNSFKTSMNNLVKAADNYYADNQLSMNSVMTFCFGLTGSNCTSNELKYSGKNPDKGKIVVNPDGEISLIDVSNGTYYANYDSSTDDEILITEDNEVLNRDELTQAIKDLKNELANTKAELAKKSNKTDLDKVQTQLTSTTTIANTANNTANSLNSGMLNKTYPVGSIYISYSSTNPSSLFGGTWVSYGTGRTLVGMDTSNANFNTIGKTGGSGSQSITLSTANLPSHAHSIPVLSGSTSANGNHSHSFSGSTGMGKVINIMRVLYSQGAYNASNHLVGGDGVNGYKDVGAGSTEFNGANHYHDFSGTTSSTGNHNHTLTTNASTSGSTGSGSAFSVNTQNPYITVYMWRRTA